jgi:hypothetical protein
VAAVPAVLAAVPPIFTAIEAIFAEVTDILARIAHILGAITPSALMLGVANIFTHITAIFAQISAVFPAIRAILGAVVAILDPIPIVCVCCRRGERCDRDYGAECQNSIHNQAPCKPLGATNAGCLAFRRVCGRGTVARSKMALRKHIVCFHA